MPCRSDWPEETYEFEKENQTVAKHIIYLANALKIEVPREKVVNKVLESIFNKEAKKSDLTPTLCDMLRKM